MDVAGLCPQASSSPSSSPGGCFSLPLHTAKPNIQSFLKENHANLKRRQNHVSFPFSSLRVLDAQESPSLLSDASLFTLLETPKSSNSNLATCCQSSVRMDIGTMQRMEVLQCVDGSEGEESQALKRAKKKKEKNKKRSESSRRMENDAKIDRESLSLEQFLASLDAGNVCPSVHDLLSILYKCRATKEPDFLLRFYAYLRIHGLETHTSLGNYLVSSLVELGSIQDALEVFRRLQDRNQCSWNALITYFVKSGDFERAFVFYTNMQADGSVLPSRHTFVALLKICAKLKDVKRGYRLHKDIERSECLTSDAFVGSSLIDMYAKCGLLKQAQYVFDKLRNSDVVSWNALIGGYANEGYAQEALDCLEDMKSERVSPNAVTFVCILKACVSVGDIYIGREIHSHISKLGLLDNDSVIGNAVVDMYAKCGQLTSARIVFENLVVRDVISWSSLITAYTNAECNEEAFACLKKMQLDGVSPNAITYASSLKACGNMEAVEVGRQLHTEITCKGFVKEHVIGTALVDMYAKCGFIEIAVYLFDMLVVQDVVSWNALISGYVKHDQPAKAFDCFQQMRANGILPDAITFVCCLKACGRMAAADKGDELLNEILEKGLLEEDIKIGNALIDMYAKCGLLAEAQDVFNRLSVRDVITWNSLIGGYVQHGRSDEALNCLKQMQVDGFSPNMVTFVCCLKACGSAGDLHQGQKLHNEISMRGLAQDFSVGNALVDMYCKCGLLQRAQELFDNLSYRDIVSWTSLIAGYVECGCGAKALACFKQMQHEAVSPDAVTYACCLRACGKTGDAGKGQEIHAQIFGEGSTEEDFVVRNALVDMYAQCGFLAQAHKLFDNLKVRDVVSWNILIAGYAEHGHDQGALNCFKQMQVEGVLPRASTYALLLKTYSSSRAPSMILQFYAEATITGLDAEDLLGSALVNALSKCGLLTEAQDVFDKLPVRDEVLWTTLIAAYAEHEQGEEALDCLYLMERDGLSLDVVTFACSLKACGSIGAGDEGQKLHDHITRKGLLQGENILGKALVDMYAKCGMIERAREVFDKLQVQDVIAWSALISGYAQFGKTEIVLHLFDKMIGEGEKPTWVTYLSVLNACCHAGMIDSGQMYLQLMEIKHNVVPTLEHYNCIVDLLSRAGQLEEALEIVEKFSFNPNHVVWQTILSACQKGGFVDLGKQVYKHAMLMQQKDASAYVCMSNMYADADK